MSLFLHNLWLHTANFELSLCSGKNVDFATDPEQGLHLIAYAPVYCTVLYAFYTLSTDLQGAP